MNTAQLPELSLESRQRIEQARTDAQTRLKEAFLESALKAKLSPALIERTVKDTGALLKQASLDDRNTAALHFLDAMAWEYMSRSAAEFEALVGQMAETATGMFDGGVETIGARIQEWLAEARERDAEGIVGERIPVRIDSKRAFLFHELQIKFIELLGSGPDLYALFAAGGQRHIVKEGHPTRERGDSQGKQFSQLARRAMSALGFRFTNPSRTVDYWVYLLRQECPHHFKRWRISGLCVASAELCVELETRALEAGAVPGAAILGRASAQEDNEDPTARGATRPQRIRDDGRASFWRKRRNEFFTHDIVEEHHTLLARWYELTDKYRFKGSQESEQAFKAIADRASQGLPQQPGREPWESWLDHLRADDRFYKIRSEGVDRYSKRGLREVLKEGFAPVVEPVISSGVLTDRDCTEFPTGSQPGDPYTNVDFTSVTGDIKNVFEASAILCKELEASATSAPVTDSETDGDRPAAPEPQAPEVHADAELSGVAPLQEGSEGLRRVLAASEASTPDSKLKGKLAAVKRYEWYRRELRQLKVATKRYQTPGLLRDQFPSFAVWAVIDTDDAKSIAAGEFHPGRFAWSLVQRIAGLNSSSDRTLKNYRAAIKRASLAG